jgi:PAS domain S-box-containing protein
MLRIIQRALRFSGIAKLKREIARRMQAKTALQHSEATFQTLYNITSDAVIFFSEQGFVDCNPACLALFGCSDKSVFSNKYPADLSPPKQACGRDSLTLANQYIAQALATGSQCFEWLHQRIDNHEVFPVDISLNAVNINGQQVIQGVMRDSRNRKLTEQRLQQSENQFRTLIENIRQGITVHDAQTKIVLHNTYALELLGLLNEQLLGRTSFDACWDILHEDGLPFADYTRPVPQAISTRLPVQGVVMCVLRPSKNDRIWLIVNAMPQFNDDGSVLQVICSFNDITRRKEAEQRLKQSEAHFRNTFDHAPIGVATLSLEGQFLTVNHTCCAMLGYQHDELLNMTFISLLQVKNKDLHLKYIRRLLSGVILSFNTVQQYVCKDNRRVWGSLSVRLIYRPDGSPDYLVATLENSDERKRVEQAMLATRNQLQATLNAIPDLLFELGLDGHCYNIHAARSDLLAFPTEQIIGKKVSDFLSPEATDIVLSALHEANETGHSQGKQLLHPCLQGNLWIELSVAIKKGATDQPHFIVLSLDITKRKLAELQLQENENRLNLSQQYGGIGSWETDLINDRQIWSKTVYQLLGFSDTVQPTWDAFLAKIHPDDKQMVIDANQTHLTQGGKYDIEYRILSAHAQTRWLRSVGQAEFTPEGTPTRFIGIVQDITDRKLMEAELKRSNADLEQFAYAVSHDMRQPLRMVTSYLTLLKNSLVQPLDEEQQQFLQFAVDGAKRMDAMILSLLDYSRVGHKTTAITHIDSGAALNEALAFLKPELQSSGGTITLFGSWPIIMASHDELMRLLQNLIANALKYHRENKPPCVEVSTLITATTLKVAVRDNGIGIDNQQFNRLFKVFSRLNAHSRFEGTGVGLALCRKIVEHHGGKIGVESGGEEQGSVFWFELPLQQADNES